MTDTPAIEPSCDPGRRALLEGLGIAALAALGSGPALAMPDPAVAANGVHDFDFLVGRWRGAHSRLKVRLAGNNDWESFGGTCAMRQILSGQGNIDENVLDLPSGRYEGVGLRLFDPKARTWSIWWIDSRDPAIVSPVTGRFQSGVGEFFSDDVLRGMPVRVRYRWSDISAASCHWEQALSVDGEKTWETNWLMRFSRET